MHLDPCRSQRRPDIGRCGRQRNGLGSDERSEDALYVEAIGFEQIRVKKQVRALVRAISIVGCIAISISVLVSVSVAQAQASGKPISETQEKSSSCKRVYLSKEAELKNEFVCECNELHCDELKFEWPQEENEYLCVVSGESGARFSVQNPCTQPTDPSGAIDRLVIVHTNKRRQQVDGYGGAFTDSAAMLAEKRLNESVRLRWLDAYFGPHGLDYNLGRITIGGSDMSERAYTCCDELASGRAEDIELNEFKLQPEDIEYKIPLVRRVNELRAARGLKEVRLLATSWSAPAWMKTNGRLVQGRLKGNASGAYYDAYARYLLRWLDAYETEHSIPIWALTPQNEPHTPTRLGEREIDFNSNPFEPEDLADFVELNLLPHLIASGRFERAGGQNAPAQAFELLLWDDTLDGFERYRKALMARPRIREFARGFALHWYAQAVDRVPYSALHALQRRLHRPPEEEVVWSAAAAATSNRYAARPMAMYSTEASIIARPKPGDWSRAAKYARDIIENLRAGTLAWIDWNLSLDLDGGPSWSNNNLDAAVLVDERAGKFYKQPIYYVLGQVARFVRAGSSVLLSDVYAPDLSSEAAAAADRSGSTSDLRWLLVSDAPKPSARTSELLVVAAELAPQNDATSGGPARKLALVMHNRAARPMRVRLDLLECGPLEETRKTVLELEPSSVTSVAFVCS